MGRRTPFAARLGIVDDLPSAPHRDCADDAESRDEALCDLVARGYARSPSPPRSDSTDLCTRRPRWTAARSRQAGAA